MSALLLSLFSLMALGTASAQPASALPPGMPSGPPYGWVRVTHDRTNVECFARKGAVCMTAPKGTVLEVLYIDGNRYENRKSNRYWIMLPPDRWGRRVTGWIRGNAVEHVQPPPAPALKASTAAAPPDLAKKPEAPVAAPPVAAPVARPLIANVVLNFDFDKSTLTADARRKLDNAILKPGPNVVGLAIELDGHADWTGPDAYNDRLGLARAEAVKKYLTEQLEIPADRVTVISFGEHDPVAPNTTRAGRAQNRRVVVKGDGS
jgi:OOP family OmpA-OmpF porin